VTGRKEKARIGLSVPGALSRSVVLLALPLAMGGCKVVTAEQDRALRAGTVAFDASGWVASVWSGRARAAFAARQVPLADVAGAARAGRLAALGAAHGRSPGVDAPFVFVVQGAGVVADVDRASPAASATVQVAGVGPVRVALGPLILSTALRDALPFVSFDDMPDQMAYGAIAQDMNRRAMAGVAPVAARLTRGQHIRFEGAMVADSAQDDVWTIVPLRLSPEAGA